MSFCHPAMHRHRLVASLALAILLGWGTAASANPDAVLGKKMAVELEAAYLATRGTWVELPTGSWTVRQFVAVQELDHAEETMLVHFRVDQPRFDESEVAAVTQTIRLDCGHASMQVIASYGYGIDGQPLFEQQMPQASSQPIASLYSGPFQMICAGTYLLSLLPDGFQRYGEALAERRTLRAARLSARPIPVPAPR